MRFPPGRPHFIFKPMILIELNEDEKKLFLEFNYPFEPLVKMIERRFCLHCGEWFTVKDFKVEQKDKFNYIVCPNAPDCDGTVIDWVVNCAYKPDPLNS